MTDTNKKMSGKLIRTGRTITFIAAGFLLVILIIEGAVQGIQTSDISGILLIALTIIALIGYILSWWKANLAGILLVMVSIAFGVHIVYYFGGNQFLAWGMMGLPHLVGGGLLLWGWRLKKIAN
ncbi:MAG: hypothetical protein PHE15_06115 [Dehalococcoidales bacterium]|nr:hypothetical protein [Dehalococcoidales bacterium]